MKQFTTYLLLLTLVLTHIQCVDKILNPNKEDKLPPITQTGENTFGCLVDGKLFIPEKTSLFGPIINVDFYKKNQIQIQTENNDYENLTVYFQMNNLKAILN